MSPRFAPVLLLALAASTAPVRSWAATPIYVETWEKGDDGWFGMQGDADPIVLPLDPTAPTPTHSQMLWHQDDKGTYLSPIIDVPPGATICVSAWINWIGGGWPFLGIERFDANWDHEGDNWLLGHANFMTGLGPATTPVLAIDGWQKYASTVTLPHTTTHIQLKDQLWFGAFRIPSRPHLAFVDSIAVYLGSCEDASGELINQCPVVSAGPPQVLECSAGLAFAALSGAAWDADGDALTCDWGQGPTSLVQPDQPFSLGTTNRTLTVSDLQCTVSDSTTVQVIDTLRPVVTCSEPLQAQCIAGGAQLTLPPAQALDQCEGVLPVIHDAPGFFGLGKTWVHYTAADKSGNSGTCTTWVDVFDTLPPLMQCPGNSAMACGSPGPGSPPAQDLCDGVATVGRLGPVKLALGEHTYLHVAWDHSGNFTVCTQVVTGIDSIAPVLTCPAAAVVECDGKAPPATASDACASTVHMSQTALPAQVGPASVTYTASDDAGNTSTCTGTISVVDTTAPIVQCPPTQTLECKSTPVGSATAIDSCDANTTVQSTSVATSKIGSASWIWTAKDGSGNTAQCAAIINIVDTIPPTLQCPLPVVVDCGGQAPAASATDLCAGAVTVAASQVATNQPGIYPVAYTASDPSGNQTMCMSQIQVIDKTKPSITCPPSVTVECGTGGIGMASASDNCLGSLKVSGTAPAASAPGNGVVTYTATDASGNSASCTATQMVIDSLAPTLTCPPAVQAECGDPVKLGTPSAEDICDPTLSLSSNAPKTWTAGSHAVTFTAMDDTGNSAKCMTKVDVVDTKPPTVTVQGFGTLWPPNHKYVTLSLDDCGIQMEDACDGAIKASTADVDAKITCVTSDEPENATGDGNTLSDIVIVGAKTVQVYGERQGTGDGRVYKVGFVVHDKAGNPAYGECKFLVPHDQNKAVVDSGVKMKVCGD